MIIENVSTLKIHKMTKEQYDRELAAGNIEANAIYLTPDEGGSFEDLGLTATVDELNYCDGVTSPIQTQLDDKAPKADPAFTGSISMGRLVDSDVGSSSVAIGYNTVASGENSFAEGYGTTAAGDDQHVQGRFNVVDTSGTYAHIVGTGMSEDNRSNAHTLDWAGNAWFKGNVYVGGTGKSSGTALLKTTEHTNVSLGQGYATCSTAASTTAKVGTLTNYVLSVGGIVAVKFTNSVPASATLNINSKGAKKIYYRGAAIKADIIKGGDIATFIYNGSQYHLLTIDRCFTDVRKTWVDTVSGYYIDKTYSELGLTSGGVYAITVNNVNRDASLVVVTGCSINQAKDSVRIYFDNTYSAHSCQFSMFATQI